MSSIDLVHQSFGRALGAKLFDRFYDLFLASHPHIPRMFENTDMEKQKHLLQHGINLSILFAKGDFAGERGMARLRASHGSEAMNIDSKFYSHWKESFLEALEICDPGLCPDTKKAWDTVLEKTIQFMGDS